MACIEKTTLICLVFLQAMKAEVGSLGELTTIQCDVSKEDDVVAMFSQIKQKYGGLDVCINNAGLGKESPILTGKSEDWQTIMDVCIMFPMIK